MYRFYTKCGVTGHVRYVTNITVKIGQLQLRDNEIVDVCVCSK